MRERRDDQFWPGIWFDIVTEAMECVALAFLLAIGVCFVYGCVCFVQLIVGVVHG